MIAHFVRGQRSIGAVGATAVASAVVSHLAYHHQRQQVSHTSGRDSAGASANDSGSTSASASGGGCVTHPGVVVRSEGPTSRAATLLRYLGRRVARLRALGRWETAHDLLAETRDTRGELTAGVRHYVVVACSTAVADDRAFDKRAALDGHGWGNGSSSSSPSGSSLSSIASSLTSSVSEAVVSTAAVRK